MGIIVGENIPDQPDDVSPRTALFQIELVRSRNRDILIERRRPEPARDQAASVQDGLARNPVFSGEGPEIDIDLRPVENLVEFFAGHPLQRDEGVIR